MTMHTACKDISSSALLKTHSVLSTTAQQSKKAVLHESQNATAMLQQSCAMQRRAAMCIHCETSDGATKARLQQGSNTCRAALKHLPRDEEDMLWVCEGGYMGEGGSL